MLGYKFDCVSPFSEYASYAVDAIVEKKTTRKKTQLVTEMKIEKELDLSKSEILNVTNKHPIGNDAKLIIENRFLVNYPKTSIMSL